MNKIILKVLPLAARQVNNLTPLSQRIYAIHTPHPDSTGGPI